MDVLQLDPSAEAALLQAVAAGDRAAFSQLYDRHATVLFSIIYRIVNNQTLAEDVLQDVFTQVWRQAGRFSSDRGRLFTWLTQIARSRALDALRKVRSRPALEMGDRADEQAGDGTPQEGSELAEQRQLVRQALQQLPDNQRELLTMAYFDGLTQSEIAQSTRLPLGTIKTRIRQGMLRLRDLLGLEAPKELT